MNIHAADSAPHVAARTPVAPPASLAGAAPSAPGAQPKDEVSLSARGMQMAENAPSIDDRVADFANRTQARLQQLAQSGAGSGQLDEISKQFAANMARVQAGIESGGLDASDAIRGARNALALVREGVRETLGTPKQATAPEPTIASVPPAVAQAPAASAPGLVVEPDAAPSAIDTAPGASSDPSDPRARLAGLGSEIADRLAALDITGFSPSQQKAFSSVTSSFESVLSRLGHALDKGAIGKERLSSIVASAIDDLSAGLTGILKSDDGLSIYGPTAGVDGFNTSAQIDGHA